MTASKEINKRPIDAVQDSTCFGFRGYYGLLTLQPVVFAPAVAILSMQLIVGPQDPTGAHFPLTDAIRSPFLQCCSGDGG
jgi:hypothetical protein